MRNPDGLDSIVKNRRALYGSGKKISDVTRPGAWQALLTHARHDDGDVVSLLRRTGPLLCGSNQVLGDAIR
jgi:hypothetical protein